VVDGPIAYQQPGQQWWGDHVPSQEVLHEAPEVGQWGLVRREGTWIVSGQLASRSNQLGAFSIFDVPLCVPTALVHYDGLCPAWEEVADGVPGAVDACTSPAHQVLAVVVASRLEIFPMRDDNADFKGPHWTIPLQGREFPVMMQWSPDVPGWEGQLRQNFNPGNPLTVSY
jgi:hypothetical protein